MITNSNIKQFWSGDGVTTIFPYNIQLPADDLNGSTLQVYTIDSLGNLTGPLTQNSQYQVDIVNSNIIYPITGTPLSSGYQLFAIRVIPLLQGTQFANQGNFNPAIIGTSLDKLIMIAQGLQDQLNRTFVAPIDETTDYSLPVPIPNQFLGSDPTGTFLTNLVNTNSNNINVNATPGTIPIRDASGNINANTFNGSLNGLASNATNAVNATNATNASYAAAAQLGTPFSVQNSKIINLAAGVNPTDGMNMAQGLPLNQWMPFWYNGAAVTLSYLSPTSFTIPDTTGYWATMLQKGYGFWCQNSGPKYQYIVAAPTNNGTITTITTSGGSDYTLDNSAITAPYWTPNPQGAFGFPCAFNMSPITYSTTGTAFTNSPITDNAVSWFIGGVQYFEILFHFHATSGGTGIVYLSNSLIEPIISDCCFGQNASNNWPIFVRRNGASHRFEVAKYDASTPISNSSYISIKGFWLF